MRFGSQYENGVATLARWVQAHAGLTVVLSLLSVVALSLGARHLTFSTDYRVYFSPENPQLQVFDEFQNVYSKNDNIFVMIRPRSGDVFQPRVLEAVRKLTREAWTLPYTLRVDSITNFQHTRGTEEGLEVAALLRDGQPITPERIAFIRQTALTEPMLLHRLISPAGDATAINIVAQFPRITEKEVPAAVAATRELRDRILQEFPEVHIAMSGASMINIAFTEASQADMRSLIPAMYLMVATICWLMLRSGWATAVTVLLTTVSTATAMGIAGYFRIGLTPPALSSTVAIMTLAVADSVHLFVGFYAAVRAGLGRTEAVIHSVRVNFTPIMITAATTAVGFLTINFADSPPLRDLGNISAAGVLMAWVYSVTLVPALMALLPVRIPSGQRSRLTFLMGRLADLVLRRQKAFLWGTAVLSIGSVACVWLNETDDNFVRYFDQSVEIRRDTDDVIARLGAAFSMDFSLSSGRSEGISDPRYLVQVDAFADWCRAQPEIMFVSSITSVFKRLNMNMHADDPAWYRLPDDPELAAQYLLLYEMSLPFGLGLNDQINVDKSSTRFVAMFKGDLTTPQMRALVNRAELWLRDNTPDIAAEATGATVMFLNITQRNIDSMLRQMPLSVLVIWLLLLPTLRSLRIGLLALLPLALPVGMAFGVWGVIDGHINFTMAVLLGIVTGIVDDDTVHFLTHYLRARREGRDVRGAVREAFESAGAAMLATSGILVGGFLLLAQSAFLPNSGMAQLTAMSITAALVLNFFLLPPILMRIDRQKTGMPNTEGLTGESAVA